MIKVQENRIVNCSSPYLDAAHNSKMLIQTFSDIKNDCIKQTTSIKKERQSYAFLTIIVVLLILSVGNLLLTLIIMGVLNFGKGIYGMEIIPEENVIKFSHNTDLERIYIKSYEKFDSFNQESMTIAGIDNAVNIRMHHRNGQSSNRMIVDESGVQFQGTNTFELNNKRAYVDNILSTHRPQYNIPNGANKLITNTNSASRIVSPLNKFLNISAVDNHVNVKGSEGILIKATNTYIQVENNIIINSTNGDLYLQSSGIYLNVDKIPIVNKEMGLRTGNIQYKICVCMPHGTLFRVIIPRIHNGPKTLCTHYNSKHDPCSPN